MKNNKQTEKKQNVDKNEMREAVQLLARLIARYLHEQRTKTNQA